MAKGSAISRTAKKVIINIEKASNFVSDVEMEVLFNIIKKIENIEYFMNQRTGK